MGKKEKPREPKMAFVRFGHDSISRSSTITKKTAVTLLTAGGLVATGAAALSGSQINKLVRDFFGDDDDTPTGGAGGGKFESNSGPAELDFSEFASAEALAGVAILLLAFGAMYLFSRRQSVSAA